MLIKRISTLFFSAILLPISTIAAPTRTHCRCTLISDTTPSPSTHQTPPGASPHDPCAALVPSLSSLQHHSPDLYATYMRVSIPAPHRENQQQLFSPDHEPRPTSRPAQRLVCRAELDPVSVYHGSFVNLWALQIIVAISILACVAEGVHLVVRWLNLHGDPDSSSAIQLPGAEKRLQITPSPSSSTEPVPSPGAEKKIRSYRTMLFSVTQEGGGRREFGAYEEDEDDEVNRPVM